MPHNRRGKNDIYWENCKQQVDKRDKRTCQFIRCLLAKEAYSLKTGSPAILDRAHIFAASSHPNLIYNVNNVITLSRYIHRRMDDYQDPLTGDPIDVNTHYYWWLRIKTHKFVEYDADTDYEQELTRII